MLIALACALGLGILSAPRLPAPSAAWWMLALGLCLSKPRRTRAVAALCLAVGAGHSLAALQRAPAARIAALESAERVVEGRVAERATALEPAWIELDRVRGLSGARRVRLYTRGPQDLDRWLPGQRVRVRARWAPVRPVRNPGRDRPGEFAGARVSGSLSHASLIAALEGDGGAVAWLHRQRREMARALRQAGDDSGILRGLALGDRRSIDPRARDALRKLGLSHVLAVSGLHLIWVAAATYAVARRGLGRSQGLASRWDTRRLALLPAIAASFAYAALAGWGVPVRRAWILLAASSAAALRRRPQGAGAPLAGAALWITLSGPAAVFELGAQLSFAVVAALLLDVGAGARPSPLSDNLRRSATACLAAAPILAWHGAATSWVALAANLLALPWIAGVLLPAALASALGSAVGLPGSGALAEVSAALAEFSMQGLRACAAELPEVMRAPVSFPAWLVAAAGAAAGLSLRSTRGRACAALLQAAWLAVAPGAQTRPGPPRLIVFDVGQGDAFLVQGQRGALLVDGGGARGDWDAGRATLVPALRALGVSELALVIATHADLDHRGGLPSVLAALPVAEVWLPVGHAEDAAFLPLRTRAKRSGARLREVGRGDPVRRFGDLRVEPLWPPRGHRGSRNAASLVVRVRSRTGSSVLLPGDLDAATEAALLAREADLRADVLLLPHHGSRGSGSVAFLDAVAPQLALASAGCRNRFGMPHPELRRRVADRGLELRWTGREGALRVALDGSLEIRGTGPVYACPGSD